MLTSQTESRSGEVLHCLLLLFLCAAVFGAAGSLLPKLRGSEDPVASGRENAKCKIKLKNKDESNDDFAVQVMATVAAMLNRMQMQCLGS